MTTKGYSKTITCTGVAQTFDAKTELKIPSNQSGYIWVYNRSSVNEIAIAYIPGVAAAIDGDDSKHIGPQGFYKLPYMDTYSFIGASGTKVEFSNDMGVF